jgi:cell division control protein 12
MLDLITTSEDLHYENYRQQQMETRKFGEPKVKKLDNPKFKEEEEQLRKRFTEQVKAEESRFRQWEQHVSLYYSFTRDDDECIGLIADLGFISAYRRT